MSCGHQPSHPITPVISIEVYGSTSITTQPSGIAISGIPLLQQPIVLLLNDLGLPDLTYIGPVFVSIQGPGTLSGTTTVTAVAGVALFLGLTITGSGVSRLVFSAPGYGQILSASITVT